MRVAPLDSCRRLRRELPRRIDRVRRLLATRGIRVVERDENRADFHRLAGLHVDLRDASPDRRRDLDLGLVGLHFEQRRVLADHVALAHEDLDDLGFGQALAQIG